MSGISSADKFCTTKCKGLAVPYGPCDQRHGRPRLCKGECRRTSDASAGVGDDDNPICQISFS